MVNKSLCFALLGSTLFIGNLAFSCTEDGLKEFLSSKGVEPTALRVITKEDGSSKGYERRGSMCYHGLVQRLFDTYSNH